jgi:hypothetical protein
VRLSLEQLVFVRLFNAAKRNRLNGRIMRFPLVFSCICPIYCLSKSQAWSVLRSLRDLGWIEIVPYQGIRVVRKFTSD